MAAAPVVLVPQACGFSDTWLAWAQAAPPWLRKRLCVSQAAAWDRLWQLPAGVSGWGRASQGQEPQTSVG